MECKMGACTQTPLCTSRQVLYPWTAAAATSGGGTTCTQVLLVPARRRQGSATALAAAPRRALGSGARRGRRAAPCVGKCVTVQELDSRRRPQRSAVNLASRCAQLPPASDSVATTAFPARWASEYAARQPILDGADAAQARAWVGAAGAVDHGSRVLAQRRGIPLTREKLRCALWKPAVDLSCRGYAKIIVDLRFVGGTRG
eukprot:COSAG01_NODE_1318_length_10746_cov_96.891425_3_plen_202_part_00